MKPFNSKWRPCCPTDMVVPLTFSTQVLSWSRSSVSQQGQSLSLSVPLVRVPLPAPLSSSDAATTANLTAAALPPQQYLDTASCTAVQSQGQSLSHVSAASVADGLRPNPSHDILSGYLPVFLEQNVNKLLSWLHSRENSPCQ